MDVEQLLLTLVTTHSLLLELLLSLGSLTPSLLLFLCLFLFALLIQYLLGPPLGTVIPFLVITSSAMATKAI